MEIAPGIHRIESPLGVRFMAQYVLAGDARTLLFDTGMPDTPAGVLRPYLESVGLRPRVARRRADQPRRPRPLGRQPRAARPASRCAFRLPRARPALDRVERRAGQRELPVARAIRVRRARRGRAGGVEGVLRRRRADRPWAARGRDDQARRRLAGRGPAPPRPHVRTSGNLGPAQPCGHRDRRGARARHLRARRDAS